MDGPLDDVEPVPPAAFSLFGDRLDLAVEFARLLVTNGVSHGLVGPREPERIWSRHLLNCAVLGELLGGAETRIVDVGSGAGLPGLVLAVARPELRVDLVEPLLRRATFLESAVERLGLIAQVRVIRGRAEERAVVQDVGGARVVTARAVAPLDRLVRWCLPLLSPGGDLLALKGASAEAELAEHRAAVTRLGGADLAVLECGADVLSAPTTVIRVRRSTRARPSTPGRSRGRPQPKGL